MALFPFGSVGEMRNDGRGDVAIPVGVSEWSGAAADEVYDLQSIARVNKQLRPVASGCDLAVAFNGDPVSLQAKLRHDGFKRAAILKSFDLPSPAINEERKRHVSKLTGPGARLRFRRLRHATDAWQTTDECGGSTARPQDTRRKLRD